MEIKINNERELPRAAAEFAGALGSRRIIAFEAPMGAGKTTFIAALCRHLGVTDDVNSPTFSLINEYRDDRDRPIYHFDFYRIESEAEALDLGLDEYFDSGALCLMEWPGRVAPLLPDDTLTVTITVNADGSRVIKMND